MITYDKCCGNRSYVTRVKTENGVYPVCGSCGARLVARKVYRAKLSGGSGNFEPFKSPIDGSVITTRRELADHNARHNVVNVHEGYDEKSFFNKVNEDHRSDLNKEASKDIMSDVHESVNMLNNGYVPQVAPEGDIP